MKINKLKIGIATLTAFATIFGYSMFARADTTPVQTKAKTEVVTETKIEEPKIEITNEREGSLWAESKYDGKNAFFNANLQQGLITLKYKDFKLEPFLEFDFKIDSLKYPWNNTVEVNPGLRLKHGIWELGLKGVNGWYHGHADMENIGDAKWDMPKKLRNGYHELQPYVSLWHGWEKQKLKSPNPERYPLTFVGEEWAKLLYHGPGSEGLNKDNAVVQGTAEAGIIVLKYKDNLIEPFYQLGLSADTKGLPWNNIISNSLGIKLKNPKQGWQIGLKGFLDKYYGNADMENIGGQGWDMPHKDRKGNSGVMLFFTLWKGW